MTKKSLRKTIEEIQDFNMCTKCTKRMKEILDKLAKELKEIYPDLQIEVLDALLSHLINDLGFLQRYNVYAIYHNEHLSHLWKD